MTLITEQKQDERASPEKSCDEHQPTSDGINDSASEQQQAQVKTRNCGHRAGFDAFMTGYCLATYLLQFGKSLDSGTEVLGLDSTQFTNRVSLSGKDVPLQIMCSHFVQPSAAHSEKLREAKEMLRPETSTWML